MTELKNVEQELSRFNTRLLAAAAFVLFGFGLLGARLARHRMDAPAVVAQAVEQR